MYYVFIYLLSFLIRNKNKNVQVNITKSLINQINQLTKLEELLNQTFCQNVLSVCVFVPVYSVEQRFLLHFYEIVFYFYKSRPR